MTECHFLFRLKERLQQRVFFFLQESKWGNSTLIIFPVSLPNVAVSKKPGTHCHFFILMFYSCTIFSRPYSPIRFFFSKLVIRTFLFTGHHRYVFMMYKQSRGRMEFQGLPRLNRHCADGRLNHRMRDFARKYNLGEPVSGNFFQAEWDESVPKLQEHFRMQTVKKQRF